MRQDILSWIPPVLPLFQTFSTASTTCHTNGAKMTWNDSKDPKMHSTTPVCYPHIFLRNILENASTRFINHVVERSTDYCGWVRGSLSVLLLCQPLPLSPYKSSETPSGRSGPGNMAAGQIPAMPPIFTHTLNIKYSRRGRATNVNIWPVSSLHSL